MHETPRRSRRCLLVGTVTLVLAVLAPPVLAESGAGAGFTVEEAVGLLAGAGDANRVTASSTEAETGAAQESRCFNDPQDDTRRVRQGDTLAEGEPAPFPRADIHEVCADFAQTLSLRLRTGAPTDPLDDPNWQGVTFAAFTLDVLGDGHGDFNALFQLNDAGEMVGRVLDLRHDPAILACEANTQFDGTWYWLSGIPMGCIDSPDVLWMQAGMFYDPHPEVDYIYVDVAPGLDQYSNGMAQVDALCTNVPPAPFADRPSIAVDHRANVDCLFNLGVAEGSWEANERYFRPVHTITRAQFAGFLYRSLEVAEVDVPRRSGNRFSDVPFDHTFFDEIHRLADAGIIEGYGDGRFGPNDPVQRDQVASLVVRAAHYATGERPTADNPGAHFRDTSASVHRDNIDAAFEAGYVEGTEAPQPGRPGLYGPAAHTMRQQMASILLRFLDALA